MAATEPLAFATPEPVLPRFGEDCLTSLIPILLVPRHDAPAWFPADVLAARQVVVLVLDGLGWEQLMARPAMAPTMMELDRRPITTVAPSTTATALTSLTTGTPPGEHGLVGYRMRIGGEVLNALRWTTSAGDVRDRIDPLDLQPVEPFVGTAPTVVTRIEFGGSGFTTAHLRGGDLTGYWVASSIAIQVRAALATGQRFVYAYYDGIDKVGHATGLGEHYEAEVAFADTLVASLLDALPSGAALLVTADHGQVETADRVETIAPPVLEAAFACSGEARFVWLHATGGRAAELLDRARHHHGHHAWVVPVEQTIDERWFGDRVSTAARERLGDVAVIPWEPIALVPPDQPGPPLVGRHGSLTADEMLVPMLSAVA